MSDEVRKVGRLIAIIGQSHTGKTTKALNLALRKTAQNSRALFVCKDLQDKVFEKYPIIKLAQINSFKGIARVAVSSRSDVDYICNVGTGFHNGLLIFDDCKHLFSQKTDNQPSVMSMLISRKQRGIDVAYIAHTPKQIPRIFYAYIDSYILFSFKGETPSSFLENVPDPKEMLEGISYINAQYYKGKKHYHRYFNYF